MDEFNAKSTTVELGRWRAGIEIGHDGEEQFVDTAWAMGAIEEDQCRN